MLKKQSDDHSGRRNYDSQAEDEDLLVSREFLSEVSEPPLKKTTFFKLLRRGVIVPFGPIKGQYYMNKSRRRMKLPPLDVSRVRAKLDAKRQRQLLFAAMVELVEEAAIVFSGEAMPENMTAMEAAYVADLVVLHGRKLDGSCAPIPERFGMIPEFLEITRIENPISRVAYVGSVLMAGDSLVLKVSLTPSNYE